MMSDTEYRAFLDALARKHLRLSLLQRRHFMELDHLQYLLNSLSNLRRLLSVAEQDDRELLGVLAKRLEHSSIDSVLNEMDRDGVIDAIEEDSQTLFSNLRRSVIPTEDVELLRAAGHSDPEAEILLIIHYCRTHLSQDRYSRNLDVRSPVELAQQAESAMERVAKRLGNSSGEAVPAEQPDSKKKRKLFNGAGKILSGGILGAGNILLGSGGVIAPNPAIAYGVIGSCAVAIGSICQGVGDLRGE